MKSVALHNLGCKVNAYELEVIGQKLQESGYMIVPFDDKADIYIVNTCTVTNIADRKSRQMLHRAKKMNPDAVVVVDEAYVDFGGESAVPLTARYPNLLVVQTFSKSRSMAGARLGYAIGDAALIQDLEAIRFSTNPYNVNRLTLRAGAAALAEQDYYDANCAAIVDTRADTKRRLEALGFTCTDSRANFLFARHPAADGGDLYRRLKERGVLVRRFDAPRIGDYIRITIGTRAQMDALLERLEGLL